MTNIFMYYYIFYVPRLFMNWVIMTFYIVLSSGAHSKIYVFYCRPHPCFIGSLYKYYSYVSFPLSVLHSVYSLNIAFSNNRFSCDGEFSVKYF